MSSLALIRIGLIVATFGYAFVVWAMPSTHTGHAVSTPIVIGTYVMVLPMLALAFYFGRLARNSADALLRMRRILQWLAFEGITILGVLASVIGGDWRLFVPLWVVSLIGFALAPPYPRRIAVS